MKLNVKKVRLKLEKGRVTSSSGNVPIVQLHPYVAARAVERQQHILAKRWKENKAREILEQDSKNRFGK